MGWIADRLTRRRLAALGLVVAATVALVALGDPLAHPVAGAQSDGRRGLVGVPRVVEISALVIAFILALPPRRDAEDD